MSTKSNVEMLSSFNWIWSEDGSSVIAVPSDPWEAQSYLGRPPRWELQIPSPRLPSDKVSFLQWEAISRHAHAFEPLFASLRICRPDFDFSGINLVTQLNNLRSCSDMFVEKSKTHLGSISSSLMTLFMNRFGDNITIANGMQ